ncbi:hypothetical protein [Vibrio superstes]|uniref:Desulfoferrodoxin N-terminal domain-containing protein n=1 Tax=Vibrio superstes NBRC 103154 TaxID=1219062 RepID=A0A511QV20_9VIBR|nr:hypothetical protein [Vibrio superstes]GEM81213.1 hypothetical protein VSU01S_34580 [Vibrio superstes NBRC 103154]
MNEQQDLFECTVCGNKKTTSATSEGNPICCGNEMQDISARTISDYKLQSLKQKSALIQFLQVLKKRVSKDCQYLDDKEVIDELIKKNTDLTLLLAKDLLEDEKKQDLSDVLINIMDDLWVSALVEYPKYAEQALSESKIAACKIFTDAAVLDRETIEALETILYHAEVGSETV